MNKIETTKIRTKILREMDTYARENFEDEDNFLDWLMDGVPDAADDDIIAFIAQNDECWLRVIKCFYKCCKFEGIID